MSITVKAKSDVLPVTVAQVKQHTNIDIDADDSLLELYIKAAANLGQNLTGRMFVSGTLELDDVAFPTGKLSLYPNLQSVTSVKYTDENDVQQTLDSSEYTVKTTGLIGYIEPVESWPSGAVGILVEFVAGYVPVDGVSTTPEDLQLWLMVKVAGYYKQRESFVTSRVGTLGVAEMPRSFIDHQLDCYVVPGFGAGI